MNAPRSLPRAAALLIASGLASLSVAQSAPSTCSMVNVTGLKPDQGVLMMAGYASSDDFFKKPVWLFAQKVIGSEMQVPLCNVSAEEIAITSFQDMNGNQKLDTNPIGIPTEPYAATGKPAMFGAPTWADTKVSLKAASGPIIVKF